MAPFMVMACVYALLLWWHYRYLDERKAIIACTHAKGHVSSVDNQVGNSWALTWICHDCPLQVPLRELLALPGKDVFWYTRGTEKWEAEHIAAIAAARRINRGLPGEEPPSPPD